jgi:AcrR family transcriptional regulator
MNQISSETLDLPLGDRLVHVALDILAEDGIEALTLRSVARRAGVSHGAPARHFRGLGDLLAEVAATGFRMLSEAIEKSDASITSSAAPMARLAAAGRAYVECALENPGLFALMFRRDALDSGNEALARDGSAAFERLLEHVRAAQTTGWHAGRDARLLAGSMWAAMHGLATLWAEGAYPGAVPGASLDDALNSIFDLVDDPEHVVASQHGHGETK